jgi:hypothetical protein
METFELENKGDGVSVKSWQGKFISAQPNGTIAANRDKAQGWETFDVRIAPGKEKSSYGFPQGKQFVIASESNENLVLDVKGADKNQGAQILLWTANGQNNQKWTYEGGIIKSVNSGLAIDVKGGAKEGSPLIQWQPHGKDNQQWIWDNGLIKLKNGSLAIDIKGGTIQQGAEVVAWKPHGNANQRWKIK